MYDVTAGHQGCLLVSGDALEACQVIEAHEVDQYLEPYADAELSDEQLLAHAWMELSAAEAPVLGRAVANVAEPAESGSVVALRRSGLGVAA